MKMLGSVYRRPPMRKMTHTTPNVADGAGKAKTDNENDGNNCYNIHTNRR